MMEKVPKVPLDSPSLQAARACSRVIDKLEASMRKKINYSTLTLIKSFIYPPIQLSVTYERKILFLSSLALANPFENFSPLRFGKNREKKTILL
jgi:hypothetical protein